MEHGALTLNTLKAAVRMGYGYSEYARYAQQMGAYVFSEPSYNSEVREQVTAPCSDPSDYWYP
jgi:hypothetical protein